MSLSSEKPQERYKNLLKKHPDRARQHQGKKHSQQSLAYLELAIQLGPTYQAGRQRAEALKKKLTLPHESSGSPGLGAALAGD